MGELKRTLVLALFLGGGATQAEVPAVTTDAGAVRGVLEDGAVVYKGIPFAEPPLADLRWKEPQAVKPWDGVRDADKFPSQCSQLGPPLPTMPEEPTSEDCLYLNLWTPEKAKPETKRPVMVFFYGGQFRRGSASTPLYASGG